MSRSKIKHPPLVPGSSVHASPLAAHHANVVSLWPREFSAEVCLNLAQVCAPGKENSNTGEHGRCPDVEGDARYERLGQFTGEERRGGAAHEPDETVSGGGHRTVDGR